MEKLALPISLSLEDLDALTENKVRGGGVWEAGASVVSISVLKITSVCASPTYHLHTYECIYILTLHTRLPNYYFQSPVFLCGIQHFIASHSHAPQSLCNKAGELDRVCFERVIRTQLQLYVQASNQGNERFENEEEPRIEGHARP